MKIGPWVARKRKALLAGQTHTAAVANCNARMIEPGPAAEPEPGPDSESGPTCPCAEYTSRHWQGRQPDSKASIERAQSKLDDDTTVVERSGAALGMLRAVGLVML
jgi:hypothetical protein